MNLRFIYVLIFSFNLLSGQVSFKAKVSKKTLGINERLQIDFLMNEDVEKVLNQELSSIMKKLK